jgi:hypothetical protein
MLEEGGEDLQLGAILGGGPQIVAGRIEERPLLLFWLFAHGMGPEAGGTVG